MFYTLQVPSEGWIINNVGFYVVMVKYNKKKRESTVLFKYDIYFIYFNIHD